MGQCFGHWKGDSYPPVRYNKSLGMGFTGRKNVACVVLSRIVLIYSFPWSKQKTAVIPRTAGATRFNSSSYWRHESSSDVMIASSSTQQICRVIHPLKACETVCILNLRHRFYTIFYLVSQFLFESRSMFIGFQTLIYFYPAPVLFALFLRTSTMI